MHAILTRTTKPLAVLALLGGLLASTGALSLAADVVSGTVTTSVISGATRYDTARLAALTAFPAGATDAVLASGQNSPDGLAAATLAGALGAPLLLTPTVALSADTTSALTTLKVKTVHVVGGTNAVSANVISQLTTAGYTVPAAIAGADRYATAAAVATAAAAIAAVGTVGGRKTAILATGKSFPDALSAGAAAFAGHLPILLTDPATLSTSASSAITSLSIANVIIMGGTNAVSTAVETAVQALTVGGTNVTTTREQGSTRFGTATAMAGLEVTAVAAGGLGMKLTNVVLASGLNFPDALVAAELSSPVVLDDPLPAETSAFLTANGAAISNIEALGGPSAVPAADLAAAQAAASAIPRSSMITALAGGVSFSVSFAQPVVAPTATNFTIDGGAAGAGITAVWAGPNTTSYVVQTTNILNAGDVVAINQAAPPTALGGLAVQPTSVTVAASTAPALTSSLFATGGTAIELQFSKPVATASLAGGLTLTSSGGATLDTTVTHWTPSQDSTAITIPVTGHAIGSADTLKLASTVVDLTPGTALALSNPQTLQASAAPAGPTVKSVHVASSASAGGTWIITNTSDTSGHGPLPTGDILIIVAAPGSPADGVSGNNYQIAFAAPGSASTVQVASAVSSGKTTITITVPSAAGVYATPDALALALDASPTFSALFLAGGAGSTDLGTTVANTAPQGPDAGAAAISTVVVTFSAPLVPASGPYPSASLTNTVADLAKYTVSGGAVVVRAYSLDNWAAPSVIVLTAIQDSPSQLFVAGTTSVTFNGAATGFGGTALVSPATGTVS